MIGLLLACEEIKEDGVGVKFICPNNKLKHHVTVNLRSFVTDKRLNPFLSKNKKNPHSNMELGLALVV